MKKDNLPENTNQIILPRIQIINQVSDLLLNVEKEPEIFGIVSNAIDQILPGVYFVVTKLHTDDMNFRIIESSGFDKYFKAIKKLVGKDPFKIDFPFKDLTEEQLKAYKSRKIYIFSDGIYDLVRGRINRTICKGIERLLDISVVCALSFSVKKKYFGGISLFIPNTLIEKNLFDSEAIITIETISNLATTHIQQLRDREAAILYESEYQLSQDRFKELINQLNDIVWIAKGDGTEIIDLNNSFEKIYGYSSAEFNRDPDFWMKIVYPEDRDIAKESAKILVSKGNSEAEYRIVRSDGEIRWIRDRKSIVFDQNGTITQVGGKATDITEQKQLEERLHIKNFALEASPIAVGLADLKGTLFNVNKAYVDLWGYKDNNDIIGKHVSEFATSKGQVGEVLNTIKQGKIYTGEGESTRLDGTKFNSLISAILIKSPDGKPICLMALFVDITERKSIELKLMEQNKQLEELISTKDKLFSIIAHDLKSPFNSILGLSEVLASDYNDLSDTERLRLINLFNLSAKNAFNLLENLLSWAKIQRGKIVLNKEELNVKNLVIESIQPYLLGTIKKDIMVKNTISENISVYADKNTMRTVIGNIFNNATKYTPKGGEIDLSAHKKSKHIEIEIKDNGIGMSIETKGNLFKIKQSKSILGTENEKGTGLGLIICKEFISKNDSSISVESEKGKGSLFKLTIPSINNTITN